MADYTYEELVTDFVLINTPHDGHDYEELFNGASDTPTTIPSFTRTLNTGLEQND